MKDVYLTRQEDLLPPDAINKSITVVGAGAIGSFTVLALAKMGYTDITVYDFDTVEPENMNCQFYPVSAIGSYKVDALKAMIKTFTDVDITVHNRAVDETDLFTGDYLICAVDSMKVRKMLFEKCFATAVLIDPRMGAEYATMEVVSQSDDHTSYKKSLYSDDEAVQERCTAKSTIYTVMLISGQIAKVVKDISTKEQYITNLDWNIRSNAMLAFSDGVKL